VATEKIGEHMTLSPARIVAGDLAALDAMELEAVDAIGSVTRPEEAEALLRKVKAVHEAQRLARVGAEYEKRWSIVRLKSERKYGELLGPKEPGKRTDLEPVTACDRSGRMARNRARQVFAIPEAAFDTYLSEADEPTRSELLRTGKQGNLAPLLSSKTDLWATPQDLFDQLDDEFGFELDVCATDSNAKCDRYFTERDDGLQQTWSGVCWMNPPYGAEIGGWVAKAKQSAGEGATVVCLVPARVDTHWWWDNCLGGEIRFLRGRLRFGGAESGAPFPSAVVILGRPSSVVWWER